MVSARIATPSRQSRAAAIIRPLDLSTSGDRPYGKYQIMGRNIPKWSKEVLGYEVTPEQFLANPQIQDAVFDGKFGGYVAKYGPIGAAQAWIGGPGSVGKTGRKDVLGTSVGEYGKRFSQALGGPASYQVGPGFKGKNPNYARATRNPDGGPRRASTGRPADPQAAGRDMLAGLGTPMLTDEEMLAMAMAAMKRQRRWPSRGSAVLRDQADARRSAEEGVLMARFVIPCRRKTRRHRRAVMVAGVADRQGCQGKIRARSGIPPEARRAATGKELAAESPQGQSKIGREYPAQHLLRRCRPGPISFRWLARMSASGKLPRTSRLVITALLRWVGWPYMLGVVRWPVTWLQQGRQGFGQGVRKEAEHLPNVEKTASAVVDPVAPKGLGIRAYHGARIRSRSSIFPRSAPARAHRPTGMGCTLPRTRLLPVTIAKVVG